MRKLYLKVLPLLYELSTYYSLDLTQVFIELGNHHTIIEIVRDPESSSCPVSTTAD